MMWQPADADGHMDRAGGFTPSEGVYSATAGREGAVRDVLWELSAQRDRIVSAVDTCGPASHRPRGIAPLPDAVATGADIAGISETPHGDARTLCRMATLPSVMKVRHACTSCIAIACVNIGPHSCRLRMHARHV